MASVQQVFTHLEFSGVTELRNPKLNPKTSDPAVGASNPGDIWYNTTANKFRYRDATQIQTFANLSDVSSAIQVGNSAPTITNGSILWLNTNSGYEGLYFRDQTRGKWLEIAARGLHLGEDNANNSNLGFAGVNNAGEFTGYNLNFDYTICEIHASCRDINNQNSKNIEIRKRDDDDNSFTAVHDFDLVREGTGSDQPGYFSAMDIDVDVSAAKSMLYMFVQGGTPNITDVVVYLVIRKRAS